MIQRIHRAFTLIELLVVVAIIVALLAILMPSMSKALEASHRAVCGSQLHQTSTLLLAYGGDYLGALPPGNATLNPGHGIDATYMVFNGQTFGLAYLITDGYLDDAKLLYCPSWTNPTLQYDVVDTAGIDPWFGPNYVGGWPAPGKNGPHGHRGISYYYRSTFGPTGNKPPRMNMDNQARSAIVTDHWIRREVLYGVEYGHRDAYVTLYGDGHAAQVGISPEVMDGIQPGPTLTNQSWGIQEIILRDWFDG